MTRYFFDLGSQDRCIYDYSGREFMTFDAASRMAELIALDLEVEGEWAGWTVAMRDANGGNCLAIPVRDADLVDEDLLDEDETSSTDPIGCLHQSSPAKSSRHISSTHETGQLGPDHVAMRWVGC